jgi:hypothetical protein
MSDPNTSLDVAELPLLEIAIMYGNEITYVDSYGSFATLVRHADLE